MKIVSVECLDCGAENTRLERVSQTMGVVSRVVVCSCGSRFETVEQVVRRLPSRSFLIITSEQMQALTARWGAKCLSCQSAEYLAWDHVIPRDRGGAHTLNNLQRLCGSCNSVKGTKTIDYRSDEQKAWASSNSTSTKRPTNAGQLPTANPVLPLGGKGGIPDLDLVRSMDREVRVSAGLSTYEPPERARVGRSVRGAALKYPLEFDAVLGECSGWRGHKGAAFRAWVKNGQPLAGRVGPVYAAWCRTDQWQRGFVPHLSTWLNARGWEKEPNAEELAGPRPAERAAPIAPIEVRREDFRRQAALAARLDRVKGELNGDRRTSPVRGAVGDTIRQLADGKAVG